MSGAKIRSTYPPGRKAVRRAQAKDRDQQAVATPASRPSRAARMLALAHYVERLIESGGLSGYAEAAGALGLTRARLTQIVNLMLLSPASQDSLLLEESSACERSLRRSLEEPVWSLQARPVEIEDRS